MLILAIYFITVAKEVLVILELVKDKSCFLLNLGDLCIECFLMLDSLSDEGFSSKDIDNTMIKEALAEKLLTMQDERFEEEGECHKEHQKYLTAIKKKLIEFEVTRSLNIEK